MYNEQMKKNPFSSRSRRKFTIVLTFTKDEAILRLN